MRTGGGDRRESVRTGQELPFNGESLTPWLLALQTPGPIKGLKMDANH